MARKRRALVPNPAGALASTGRWIDARASARIDSHRRPADLDGGSSDLPGASDVRRDRAAPSSPVVSAFAVSARCRPMRARGAFDADPRPAPRRPARVRLRWEVRGDRACRSSPCSAASPPIAHVAASARVARARLVGGAGRRRRCARPRTRCVSRSTGSAPTARSTRRSTPPTRPTRSPRCSTPRHRAARTRFVGCSYGAMVGLRSRARIPARAAAPGRDQPARTRRIPSPARGARCSATWSRSGSCSATKRAGLSLARQLAMLSYRTPEEFAERFDAPATLAGGARALRVRGLARRIAAPTTRAARRPTAFLRLSESIDLHASTPPTSACRRRWSPSPRTGWCRCDDVRALAARHRRARAPARAAFALRPRRLPQGNRRDRRVPARRARRRRAEACA